MKRFLFILLLAPLWLFSQSRAIVPYNVQKKFDEKYPTAAIFYWEDFMRQYMVYYEVDDNFYYARMDLSGNFMEGGISLDKPFAIPTLVKKAFDLETGGTVPVSEAFKSKLADGTDAFFLVGFTLKAKYEILVAKDGRMLRHEEGVIETIEGDDDEDEEDGDMPIEEDDKGDENERDPRRMEGEGDGQIHFRNPKGDE